MAEITATGKGTAAGQGTILYFRAPCCRAWPNCRKPTRRCAPEIDARPPTAGRRFTPAWPVSTRRRRPACTPTDSQPQRLEICLLSGRKMSRTGQSESTKPPYDFPSIGLLPSDRSVLHERTPAASMKCCWPAWMTRSGCCAPIRPEPRLAVDALRRLPPGLGGARKGCTASRKCDRGIFATRQLAKRQITWH